MIETPVVIAMIVSIPPTVAALAAMVVGMRNTRKLQSVRVQLDGRLSELLKLTQKAAFAAGVESELSRQPPSEPSGNPA